MSRKCELQHREQGGETRGEVGGWGRGARPHGLVDTAAGTRIRGPVRTERQGRCCVWGTKASARARRTPRCADTALRGNVTAPVGSPGWVLLIPHRQPSLWPSPVVCLCTSLAASPLADPPESPGLGRHEDSPWQRLSFLPCFSWFVYFTGLEASCYVSLEHMKGSAYFPHTVAPQADPGTPSFRK